MRGLLAVGLSMLACTGTIEGGTSSAVSSLPGARVRRLTRVEIDSTLTAALGSTVSIAAQLATEDSVLGYTDHEGLLVTTLFADQLDTATTALAATAAADPAALLSCAGTAEAACVKAFAARFGSQAWRRPLTDAESSELLALYQSARTAGDNQADSLSLLVQAVIESTGFLYRTELGEGGSSVTLTPYEVASAISYLVVAGPPDAELIAAAETGKLVDADGRAAQMQRLLSKSAARQQLRTFVKQWLGLTNVAGFQKDNNVFPAFSTDLRSSIATSTDSFIDAVLFEEGGKVSTLFGADFTYADDRLAGFLESTARPGSTAKRISMASLPRRGILNQPGFLAVYAHNDDGSPTLRGKAVRTRVLCDEVPPPPPSVVVAVLPVSATETTRERSQLHASAGCAGCHVLLDPVGFGFESFDGLGGHRTTESGKPIDDSGNLAPAAGKTLDIAGDFVGAVALANKLASSKVVAECAAKQMTRFAIGRKETIADLKTLEQAENFSGEQGGSVFGALEGVIRSDGFVHRRGL